MSNKAFNHYKICMNMLCLIIWLIKFKRTYVLVQGKAVVKRILLRMDDRKGREGLCEVVREAKR